MKWAIHGAGGPIVCGHRGAPAIEPENTLAGFAAAATRGATWIEFDVRPTNDGVLAIHHDPVTSQGQRLASVTYGELDSAIPRFGDMAAAVPQLGLDIEMKTDDIDMSLAAFADLVIHEIDEHCAGRDDIIVTSFDADALQRVRDRRPSVATGLLFDHGFDDALACALDVGHVVLAPWIRILDAELVDRSRHAGFGLATWTVNEPAQVVLAASLGVDMIIGDDPQLITENL